MRTILAIETSCDETAISLVQAEWRDDQPHFLVRHHAVASQTAVHAPFGGVVPRLARREHEKNLPILMAGLPSTPAPDLIAVTVGPGLEPALWVGLEFARALARERRIPLYPTNHLAGHLYSPLIRLGEVGARANTSLTFVFPVLALIASGGHTELVLAPAWGRYERLGQTRDDAVGEAYDKAARLLGLPYPGGPALAALAEQARQTLAPNARLDPPFPRPMIATADLDFSFSGLKTAIRYRLQTLSPEMTADPLIKQKFALAFEEAALDSLVAKTALAVRRVQPRTLVLGGGVAANRALANRLNALAQEQIGRPLLAPASELTGDNATMIAAAAEIEIAAGARPLNPGEPDFEELRARGQWPLNHSVNRLLE